jgi:two-component system cell cycle response regulator DivK
MKILVIEDNLVDLKLVHSVLAHGGHQVSDSGSAEQAVELLLQETPEVILTDLDLPLMDGLTLTRQLKQAPATSTIPIIAMTAYPDHFTKQAIRTAGFAAYLIKPLDTRMLCQQVTEALKTE